MLGLDSGVVPTLVTRVAVGDGEGARRLFRRGLALAAVASALLTLAAIPAINWLARARNLDAFPGGGAIMLLALPCIAVARISTGASRAVLAMRNEFYSRGLTETWVTTGVFVIAIEALRLFLTVQTAFWPAASVTEPLAAQSPPNTGAK